MKTIETRAAFAKWQNAVTFLDVRESAELDAGYIRNALNIPRALIQAQVAEQLPDKNIEIIVYCQSGKRSQAAVAALLDLGYTNAITMSGGIAGWLQENFPVETKYGQLTRAQIQRYSRNINVPEIGYEGQLRLLKSRVLIVGLGGLGSPAALYLAGAGVGHLGLMDFDKVDLSNLQRQILYSQEQIGESKTAVAAERIQNFNPDVTISAYDNGLQSGSAREIIADYDLILDCTDSFPARYLINDVCVALNKPFIQGSVNQMAGTVAIFNAPGPCFRCFSPEPPPSELSPTCAMAGVIGAVPGLVGTMQALEAIKFLTGNKSKTSENVLSINAGSLEFRWLKTALRPGCRCGETRSISKKEDHVTRG